MQIKILIAVSQTEKEPGDFADVLILGYHECRILVMIVISREKFTEKDPAKNKPSHLLPKHPFATYTHFSTATAKVFIQASSS
jgi:hypothetical protein